MGFEFKLEALRRYRHFKEEMLQKELAQMQRHRDREIALLAEMIDKRTMAEQDMIGEQEKRTHGPRMALYETYLNGLTQDIKNQRQRVKEAQALCSEKMNALLKAVQERKSIEKLKEKGLKAYIEKLDRNEQKFLNEIAINRFARADN
jgi:flagellar FliJ protein